MKYYRPSDTKVIYLFLWAEILTLAWVFATKLILYALTEKPFMNFYDSTIPLRFIVGTLFTISIISLLYVFFNEKSKRDQQRLKADTEKLARDMELSALREQLQPHFLFNALNSIHALVSSRPEEARKMIVQLSEFLRGNLTRESRTVIPLQEEMEHLRLYLEIEKVRFGYRLNVEINVEETCEGASIPPLLLQPLIENAIKYGLYDTIENVVIRLTAKCEDKYLVISVSNPFDPDSSKHKKGTGFGHNSAKRRLFLLYGRKDLFETGVIDSTYIATVKIPQL